MPTALCRKTLCGTFLIVAAVVVSQMMLSRITAQTRRRPRTSKPTPQQQAPKGSAATKYSAFLHSSDKHKSLACNGCHKIPTAWTAKRNFPDVADFPDHDACVRCHRQQFFTRQSMIGTGPTICTVCHVRAAPREDARFAFGNPNDSNQATKSKEEWQFTIEFPHDKHQNAIALIRPIDPSAKKRALAYARASAPSFDHAAFRQTTLDDQKVDYNNCSICHVTNQDASTGTRPGAADSFVPPAGTFKTTPRSHDACFDCHWKNLKPASDDCAGCHKPAVAFVPATWPKRISAKFAHEGGKGGHVMECTTCHINITRASTLRGLTPDVPIAACTTCHKDNKKITYPKITTIEEEFEQNKKTGACIYCHTSDVGKKKPPASHDAAAQ
ncbi:MAG TPA: cytochrome c3 family protein [Pyrinomonadaceae bacterium]|nr:cytochrome c3 family protein [Pyrinomonadaceae bacterium]